jgi:hypothetical protein
MTKRADEDWIIIGFAVAILDGEEVVKFVPGR